MKAGTLSARGKWVKWLPHVIDTGILLSGLSLIKLTGFTPLNSHWLALKLVLLLAYIIFGAFALRYGHNQRARTLYLIVAGTAVVGIMLLAIMKPDL